VRKYILCLIFFVHGLYIFATGQFFDILIWNGNEYRITANYPMQDYFNKYPEKQPFATSSALQRGYIATFEIIENEIWVIDIKKLESRFEIINGSVHFEYTSIISECLNGKDRMKVDWYNGFIIIPQGKIIGYEEVGYEASFENYIIIEIQNGKFLREFNLNFEQYREFFETELADIYWKGFSN
jgi:hypothetical protein